MTLSEAYKILGVNEQTSEEDIKKAYKKLAAKYHPDVYKLDDGDMFKKVNNAYEKIKSGEMEESNFNFQDRSPLNDSFIADFFNNVRVNKTNSWGSFIQQDIEVKVFLTLKEFSLGIKKDIIYVRTNSNGIREQMKFALKIHPMTFQKMIARGKGNFVRAPDIHTDVYVSISVLDANFKLVGDTLETTKEISLHDAIHGVSIDEDLFFTKVHIKVPELTKNSDICLVSTYNTTIRKLKVTFKVMYPNNIKELV
jgi:curved DNA-binding protein